MCVKCIIAAESFTVSWEWNLLQCGYRITVVLYIVRLGYAFTQLLFKYFIKYILNKPKVGFSRVGIYKEKLIVWFNSL